MRIPRILACLILIIAITGCYGSQRGVFNPSGPSYPQVIVENAVSTVRMMDEMDESGTLSNYLKTCKGVMIFPGIVKAAVIYGGQGGNGVLLTRNEIGEWSSPAFYTLGGVSWGLQAGVQEVSMLMVFMNENTLANAMESGFTIGADASAVAVNLAAKANTFPSTSFQDVYYFGVVDGLFAGVSLEGGAVTIRKSYNETYYDVGVQPRDIVIYRNIDNPDARILKTALKEATR